MPLHKNNSTTMNSSSQFTQNYCVHKFTNHFSLMLIIEDCTINKDELQYQYKKNNYEVLNNNH